MEVEDSRVRRGARRRRPWAVAAVAVMLFAPLAPAPAEETGPAEGAAAAPGAQAMLEGLFADLWKVTSGTASDAEKRDAIERELEAHLDAEALTRNALGPLADRFTPEEYADLAAEYSRYVTWLLTQRIADAETPAKLVETKLEGPGKARALALGRDRRRVFPFQRTHPPGRVEVLLSLLERDGQWRVAAVRFDGIDVGANFREQFAAVLERSKPSDLIAELRSRNLENASRNPFESP
jgi:ABC-type transporter MlaC component